MYWGGGQLIGGREVGDGKAGVGVICSRGRLTTCVLVLIGGGG